LTNRNIRRFLEPETLKRKRKGSRTSLGFKDGIQQEDFKRNGQSDSNGDTNILTSQDFRILQLTDLRNTRVKGIKERRWRVIGTIAGDGSFTSSSEENRREVFNEEQEVNSIFPSLVAYRPQDSLAHRRVNNKQPEGVSKHPHRSWKKLTTVPEISYKSRSSRVSSGKQKNLFRVVTAVAPPFVQESTRIENRTCLTGVICLRVSLTIRRL
jgi:hypothetical protein